MHVTRSFIPIAQKRQYYVTDIFFCSQDYGILEKKNTNTQTPSRIQIFFSFSTHKVHASVMMVVEVKALIDTFDYSSLLITIQFFFYFY